MTVLLCTFHRNCTTVAAILVAFAACFVTAGAAGAGQNARLTELADGVYVHRAGPDTGADTNAGIVVLEHGVVVFDTHSTPEAGRELQWKIATVTSKPILLVINSHFHAHHTHGNQAFGAVPYFVSSGNTRRDILERDLPALNRAVSAAQVQIEKMRKQHALVRDGDARAEIDKRIGARRRLLDRMMQLKIVAPEMTFDDELRIVDGSRVVILRRLGAGHTDGDIVMYLPAEKIAFVGDLFFNAALPGSQDAVLLEWPRTLDELLKIDAESFVPGHGAVGRREDVRGFAGYLDALKRMVQESLDRGDTLEHLIQGAKVPEKYAGHGSQELFPSNVQKMYTELKALQAAARPAGGPEGVRKPRETRP
ncbi:MAG: MBL fold metallo-hydrolase [Acidobacteria bacterium]|nr:MBL fold metallo-hydrolase [Acidobacteriota bacterium]